VAFATANGTATAGTDYTATAGTLSFPEGTPSGSTRTIAVPILNETLKENNETFGLTLSGPSGASLGVATQTVTIQDNDTPVISLLPFTSGPGTSGEHIGTATARIQVTTGDGNALAAVASAKYATGAGPAPSATAADYIPVALTALSFPVGTPSGTTHNVNVTIKQDTLVESDENFRVNLSAPVGAVLGTASVTVQIQDDEPTIALTSAIASVAESAGSIGVTVRLNTRSGFPTATAGAATVNYATANGTAVQASDYTRTTGVMTFPAGTANNATQTITVPILNDAVVEAAETFRVNITTPVGCRLGTPTTTTVTIQDDVGGRPQIINSLPYVVQKPGRYILVRSLSTDMTSGAAITVESDSVVLDLSGFALANTSGPETQAFGIHGVGRRDVVVRNGTIRGFLTAVKLEEGALLRVDDILAIGSRFSGLEICGSDSLVLRNRVVDTGADGSAFGIVACGSSLQVLDNDVLDTLGPEAHSVELRDASGAVISANRVGHSTPSSGVGLLVRDSEGVVVKGNRITGVERGIVFERSTGASMDNVMSGVAVPEEGVQP
jgi:hypothetical protein